MQTDYRKAHLVVLAIGFVFLLTGAFHNNIWFDETYSVAIARYSFADIWSIGSCDVHPVLYYWALHVLYLLFGTNLVAYRIFTICGAWCLALLGYTHVRRDFGDRAGLLFSFFTLFAPYVALMSIEIRMYSWATFTVGLCLLTAWRIMCGHEGANAPAGQWAVFAVSSLASAYLHYFGAIAAALINVVVFVYLIVHARTRKRDLVVFVVLAAAQLGCYVPWLFALSSQLGVVGNKYWAQSHFPLSYIEHATYFVATSFVSFALRGQYGVVMQVVLTILVTALLLLAVAGVIAACVLGVRKHRALRKKPQSKALAVFCSSRKMQACLFGFVIYLGTYLVGIAAGYIMNSYIMYYRYLFVPFGALAFAFALLLSVVKPRWIVRMLCAVLLGVSILNQALLIMDDYSPENGEVFPYFEQTYEEWNGQGGLEDGRILVLSSDIGIEGVTALTCPDIPQTYMNWEKGNWGGAYKCYEPTLTEVRSWEEALDNYHGYFIVLGASQTESQPRDIYDLSHKDGMSLVSQQMFYRPYERTHFAVAVLYKE